MTRLRILRASAVIGFKCPVKGRLTKPSFMVIISAQWAIPKPSIEAGSVLKRSRAYQCENLFLEMFLWMR